MRLCASGRLLQGAGTAGGDMGLGRVDLSVVPESATYCWVTWDKVLTQSSPQGQPLIMGSWGEGRMHVGMMFVLRLGAQCLLRRAQEMTAHVPTFKRWGLGGRFSLEPLLLILSVHHPTCPPIHPST